MTENQLKTLKPGDRVKVFSSVPYFAHIKEVCKDGWIKVIPELGQKLTFWYKGVKIERADD